MMYLVKFNHSNIDTSAVNLTLNCQQTDELTENLIVNFVKNQQSNSDVADFELVLFAERLAFDGKQATVLTADNTLDELSDLLNDGVCSLVFFVQDFKDGRTFSLIRHLRNQGFSGEIYLLGEYGLDQAVYYQKSGATGFFVKDTQLETLLKTLNDLKSGHFGQSAKTLPMFCGGV